MGGASALPKPQPVSGLCGAAPMLARRGAGEDGLGKDAAVHGLNLSGLGEACLGAGVLTGEGGLTVGLLAALGMASAGVCSLRWSSSTGAEAERSSAEYSISVGMYDTPGSDLRCACLSAARALSSASSGHGSVDSGRIAARGALAPA